MRARAFLATYALLLAALIAPAGAQATGLITNSLGEPASQFTATSENIHFATSVGTLTCGTFSFFISLTENTSSTALGDGFGEGSGKPGFHDGPCELASAGLAVHIDSVTVNPFHLESSGDGEIEFDFTWTITHPLATIMCSNSVIADVDVTAPDELEIGGFTSGNENIPPCPMSGSATGDFVLTDELDKPVTIH